MRTLSTIDEFQKEAPNAIFTKEQAMQISLKLLKKELDLAASENDCAVIRKAIEYFSFHYLDDTDTPTDTMLDSFHVARLTTNDIVTAINNVVFDAR